MSIRFRSEKAFPLHTGSRSIRGYPAKRDYLIRFGTRLRRPPPRFIVWFEEGCPGNRNEDYQAVKNAQGQSPEVEEKQYPPFRLAGRDVQFWLLQIILTPLTKNALLGTILPQLPPARA